MTDTETKNDLTNKLVRLHNELADVRVQKKASAKDYRDQIKDLEDEINDVVETIESISSI